MILFLVTNDRIGEGLSFVENDNKEGKRRLPKTTGKGSLSLETNDLSFSTNDLSFEPNDFKKK